MWALADQPKQSPTCPIHRATARDVTNPLPSCSLQCFSLSHTLQLSENWYLSLKGPSKVSSTLWAKVMAIRHLWRLNQCQCQGCSVHHRHWQPPAKVMAIRYPEGQASPIVKDTLGGFWTDNLVPRSWPSDPYRKSQCQGHSLREWDCSSIFMKTEDPSQEESHGSSNEAA